VSNCKEEAIKIVEKGMLSKEVDLMSLWEINPFIDLGDVKNAAKKGVKLQDLLIFLKMNPLLRIKDLLTLTEDWTMAKATFYAEATTDIYKWRKIDGSKNLYSAIGGKLCPDNDDHKNICDGSERHCWEMGKSKCDKLGPFCHGVMVHPTLANILKGVKLCKSSALKPQTTKTEEVWKLQLKNYRPPNPSKKQFLSQAEIEKIKKKKDEINDKLEKENALADVPEFPEKTQENVPVPTLNTLQLEELNTLQLEELNTLQLEEKKKQQKVDFEENETQIKVLEKKIAYLKKQLNAQQEKVEGKDVTVKEKDEEILKQVKTLNTCEADIDTQTKKIEGLKATKALNDEKIKQFNASPESVQKTQALKNLIQEKEKHISANYFSILIYQIMLGIIAILFFLSIGLHMHFWKKNRREEDRDDMEC
jgi:hypothetical protein